MQNAYVGDIGDYGKYGLLRSLIKEKFSVSVNWYYVKSEKRKPENSKPNRQKPKDGKYIDYLCDEKKPYKDCDPDLFKLLYKLVYEEDNRKVEAIKESGKIKASFFGEEIGYNRELWHEKALNELPVSDIIFLDPDNGLQTNKMHEEGRITPKHVAWEELGDYYHRGQTVVLYQHRPQMTSKETCISSVMEYGRKWLKADEIFVLEYPAFTNRFYFIFAHKKHKQRLNEVCDNIVRQWSVLGVKRHY